MKSIFEAGKMIVGCNYWASHAGINMWRDWRPDVIDTDFSLLAEHGFRVLRLFPLWSEFQPLELLCGGYNEPFELSLRGRSFPDTPAGRAGLDAEMIERFGTLLDLAERHGLKVGIGLITGWMSGRIFAPPAFSGRNLISDCEVMMWQERMIRFLVRTFHAHPAVAAWGPGNECNAMSPCDRFQARLWLATMTRAIRDEDPEHPILSGMHSLTPGDDVRVGELRSWQLIDQHELVDFFTTHPYPPCVPHAGRDGLGSFRNALHPAAEGCFYADLGGKPCVCEEFGTLAPEIGGERLKRAYIRKVMRNLWAHDGRAALWWCAFDQDQLDYAPYEWNSAERRLGLFTSDRRLKPFASELTESAAELTALAPAGLPPRRTDAVVVHTHNQDRWGNCWSAFLLAKQAGFDVRFASGADELPDSSLYILPGVCGISALDRRRWLALLERVRQGATLYLSMDEMFLCPFTEVFDFESAGYVERTGKARFTFDGAELEVNAARQIRFDSYGPGLEVLARESDGNPALITTACGRGRLYALTVPLERYLAESVNAFPLPYYRIYRHFAAPVLARRELDSGCPGVTVTLHPEAERVIAVAVNNLETEQTFAPQLAAGWRIAECRGGGFRDGVARLAPGDVMRFDLTRR